MSDVVVGNPGYPQNKRLAVGPHIRIMFLGGRLDHTIRTVPSAEGHLDRPASPTYHCWAVPRAVFLAQETDQHYELRRVDNGLGAWFCYVLVGFTPSPSDLLDTNPFPI